MGTIYILENKINGKCYVGQTTHFFNKRFREHQSSNSILGKALRKYKIDNFNKLLLEYVPEEELDYWECHYIQECDSLFPCGYNFESGGNKNKHHHEETKKKMSEAKKGKPLTEETKKKMRKSHISYSTEKLLTEETKKKMSEAKKGKVSNRKGQTHTEESKKKMSEAHKGHITTEETKKKLKEKNARYWLGKHHTEETKRKLSEIHIGEKSYWFGRHHTKEAKEKISITHLGHLQSKITCPYCGKIGGNAMYRWHFNNCKNKRENDNDKYASELFAEKIS